MALFSRRKKTAVGLDIGSGLVKVAVIDHGGTEPELVRVAMAPLLTHAIVEGEVMDPVIVSDAILSCLGAVEVQTPAVATAVGGRDVIVKKITIDRVKESQAQELMRWEAEQHVPFDMDSVELDFQILDPDATDEQMQVLLVAAKRELVEAKLRVLAEPGLTAAIVDVDSFALHNAFERSHPEAMSGGGGARQHRPRGHQHQHRRGRGAGAHSGPRRSTRRFREDLQRDLGLSVEEATAVLDSPDRSTALDAVLVARGEEIAVGIERAAAFLASSSRSLIQVASVYVCGGGARTPGLLDTMGARLRVPIMLATPLANLAVRDGAFESLEAEEVAPLFMQAIGLALRVQG